MDQCIIGVFLSSGRRATGDLWLQSGAPNRHRARGFGDSLGGTETSSLFTFRGPWVGSEGSRKRCVGAEVDTSQGSRAPMSLAPPLTSASGGPGGRYTTNRTAMWGMWGMRAPPWPKGSIKHSHTSNRHVATGVRSSMQEGVELGGALYHTSTAPGWDIPHHPGPPCDSWVCFFILLGVLLAPKK